MTTKATRWGICSAGLISYDFTAALQLRPSEHQVVAVAARDLHRAQELASKFSIPKAYGSYQELAADSNIDVIYIGNLHPYHEETCCLFIKKGKNVVCEKPLAMNLRQAERIVQLTEENNVFLVEGFWSRFFPAYHQLRKELASGTIGTPKYLNINFGVDVSTYKHPQQFLAKWSGGGAVLRAGCYMIMFANLIFPERPEKIHAVGFLNSEGVDTVCSITLLYSGHRMAQLTIHLECPLTQTATICGTKGILQMPGAFHMTDTLITPQQTFQFERPKSLFPESNFPNTQCLIYEADAVRECLIKGEKESELMSHRDSLEIMWILDEVRKQMGVTYDADRLP